MIVKIMAMAALGVISTQTVQAAPAVLTGDTRLACEATMCLLAASKPSECNASLKRYFSITSKKAKKQAKARANFLKKCPK